MPQRSCKPDTATQMMIEVLKRNGWVRMPGYPRGEDNVCGLRGRELSKLERARKIKTFRLDAPNGIYCGIWFVHKPSVERYLNNAKEQKTEEPNNPEPISQFEEAAKKLEEQGLVLSIKSNPDYKEDWTRLPNAKREICGMRRGTLEQLCKNGKIKSVHLKSSEHAKSGIRLIWVPSVYEYLEKLSIEQRSQHD